MIFKIENQTQAPITIGGTTYAVGAWIPITNYIGEKGLSYKRVDVSGKNSGTAKSGASILDRTAKKHSWGLNLLEAINEDDAQAILKLVEPVSFNVSTDYPTGTETGYEVYVTSVGSGLWGKTNTTEYYGDLSIALEEVYGH